MFDSRKYRSKGNEKKKKRKKTIGPCLSCRNLIPFTTVSSDLLARVPKSFVHVQSSQSSMFLRFQFFYARLTLAVPFSFFLPLPLFPPISSDGVSLLHFARSRSFHAGHRFNRRWVEGCRIGRRIREIAGTMDSLASTRFTFETFLFAETRGNLAEILEKIRSRFGGSG